MYTSRQTNYYWLPNIVISIKQEIMHNNKCFWFLSIWNIKMTHMFTFTFLETHATRADQNKPVHPCPRMMVCIICFSDSTWGVRSRVVKGVVFRPFAPIRCTLRIPTGTLDSFMWVSYLASLRNVGCSTQVPVRTWNNERTAPEVFLNQ
jgi:hypothetical protein